MKKEKNITYSDPKNKKREFFYLQLIAIIFGLLLYTCNSSKPFPKHRSNLDNEKVERQEDSLNSMEGSIYINQQNNFVKQFNIRPLIDWEMEKRFSVDMNQNNLPDLPNTFEYAHNLPANFCGFRNCDEIEPKFKVTFDANKSTIQSNFSNRILNLKRIYAWEIKNRDSILIDEYKGMSPILNKELKEGIYIVKLTIILCEDIVKLSTGLIPKKIVQSESSSFRISIEDIVIVSVGDSFSSGEGNPERHRNSTASNSPAIWADDGRENDTGIINKRHRKAHRSTLSWPAQLAMEIENADKHTSVTFISVATTGAKLMDGITTGDGADFEEMPEGGLPDQLDELKSIIDNRTIDLFLVSAGINDAGFSKVLASYIYPEFIDANILEIATTYIENNLSNEFRKFCSDLIVEAALTGNWDAFDEGCTDCIGVNKIRESIADLNEKITSTFNNKIGEIVMLGYPDPTTKLVNGNFSQCDEILSDIGRSFRAPEIVQIIFDLLTVGLRIDNYEQTIMVNEILEPLNKSIWDGTSDVGWKYVSTEDLFYGHGYCAEQPNFNNDYTYDFGLENPYPEAVPASGLKTSWIRTGTQSSYLQGPLGIERIVISLIKLIKNTTGTMHPNELGHQAVKERVLSLIRLPIDIEGIGFHDNDDQLSEAPLFKENNQSAEIIKSRTDVNLYQINEYSFSETENSLSDMNSGLSERQKTYLEINLKIHEKWSPLLRVYNQEGVLISENSEVIDNYISLKIPITKKKMPYMYVAVSALENSEYDIFTGSNLYGGKGGVYTLSCRKVTSPILQQSKPSSGTLQHDPN